VTEPSTTDAAQGFIHLRVHSAYSLSEGAIQIKALPKLCKAASMPAVAVTDTNNLFGAMQFSKAAADAGIQPILGCQLAVALEIEPDERFGQARSLENRLFASVVLLVQDETGYRNLCKLLTIAYDARANGDDPHVPMEMLGQYGEGLICLTGGEKGPVGQLLLKGRKQEAAAAMELLVQQFPGRLYVELMRHGTRDQYQTEPDFLDFADQYDLPLVATNDCMFDDKGMFAAHDALVCIANGRYVDETNRPRVTAEHYFKSATEMRQVFNDLPEAVDNTLVIARRCAYWLGFVNPILPPFATEAGRSEVDELRAQGAEGLEERLVKHVFTEAMSEAEREEAAKPYRERLEFELGVIIDMGFPGYFLIVSDFIKWAKDNEIPVGPGRGSGAGSVVAWALTITDLDPLEHGLLFERFLNPERVSMPDFDIDFCQHRRDEVINYVREKYGNDRVAQIITFGKFQARMVVRDVGRVLQMPYGQVDRITKMIPNNPANPVTLQEAIDGEPALREMRRAEPTVARLLDIALKLEGLYRHASTHAAGVVIGDRPLEELVPLYRDPRSDMRVTQFNMKDVETAGLVKFDFLGLTTLTILQSALDLMKQREIDLDLAALPLEDEKTYELLSRGDTAGVFQLESTGMREWLRKLKPSRFEDIVAMVSLYRPGPMDNIPKYISVKMGEEPPDYLHPSLQPILEETFGIMIYQEQVMQIAQVLSGYSLGGADLLRRAMGKKIKEEMDKQRELFVAGAVERSVDGDQASSIFDQVAKFAGYGFNKSHAAAYALLAYHTGYLKANYPVEFMAAIMTLAFENTDKLASVRQELQRLNITLLPPDINKSESLFSVEKMADGKLAIRYALAGLKGVGLAAMQSIVTERRENGPYKDISDFANRIDPQALNRKQIEQLAKAGAFDALEANRHKVVAGADTILRHAATRTEERKSSQVSLFGGGNDNKLNELHLNQTAEWPKADALAAEFEAIGFYLSAHPLDSYEVVLNKLRVVGSRSVLGRLRSEPSTRVQLAGVVLSRQERRSADGNKFAFVQMSDREGTFEVRVYSELLAISRDQTEPGKLVLLSATASAVEDSIRFRAHAFESLDEAVARASSMVEVYLRSVEAVDGIRSLLERQGKGRTSVNLIVRVDENKEVTMQLPQRFAVDAKGRAALKSLAGVDDVQER
jgi:DNA polymerase III subunit alpha